MAENQNRARPGRKPNTPSLDSIRQAVERGEYDDYLNDLTRMIQNRRDELKKTVMARVREVFGPDATVVEGKSASSPLVEAENPFARKARVQQPEESETKKHEFRIDPKNGNAMRLTNDSEAQQGDSVVICDVLGGHVATLPKSEWEGWAIATPDGEAINAEPLSELDEVEARMAGEDASDAIPTPSTSVPVDIERRGASISGLHSSDMGGP